MSYLSSLGIDTEKVSIGIINGIGDLLALAFAMVILFSVLATLTVVYLFPIIMPFVAENFGMVILSVFSTILSASIIKDYFFSEEKPETKMTSDPVNSPMLPVRRDSIIYLDKNGENFHSFYGAIIDDKTPSVVKEALACNNPSQVYAFLKSVENDKSKIEDIKIMHDNNTAYPEHVGTAPKGNAHECPLKSMIQFVESQQNKPR